MVTTDLHTKVTNNTARRRFAVVAATGAAVGLITLSGIAYIGGGLAGYAYWEYTLGVRLVDLHDKKKGGSCHCKT